MKKIEAKIIADSLSPQGHRITSFILTYPRFIHPELMTHRVFSRNSASSRAIPFEKMVKMVEEDPFIPLFWQKDHKGMQGNEYFTDEKFRIDIGDEFEYKEDIQLATKEFKIRWFEARDNAINVARGMNNLGLTKQLCNRLLEPFLWHTVLVTATEWDNFFELRCPQYHTKFGTFRSIKDAREAEIDITDKNPNAYILETPSKDDIIGCLLINNSQAEIHIQALAESMWDAMNESKPKHLESGQWHVPFGDKIDAINFVNNNVHTLFNNGKGILQNSREVELKVAVARCARLSYMTFDGEIDYIKDIQLHDTLLKSKHMSPFEHCARAMNDDEYYTFVKGEGSPEHLSDALYFYLNHQGWCNNFRGFIPYRYLIENK